MFIHKYKWVTESSLQVISSRPIHIIWSAEFSFEHAIAIQVNIDNIKNQS